MSRTQNILSLSSMIVLALALGACDDSADDNDPIYIGGNVAGQMTAGTDIAGAINAGTDVAGTMTAGTGAGTMTAGTEVAGTMTAGTEVAGTMTAGTEVAGTMTAGTMTAGTGMTAGTEVAGTMTAGTEMTAPDCSMATVEAPCQVSIYSARQVDLVPDLVPIEIEGVVTAIRINEDGNASHIVLQDPASGPWSGIWVYLNDAEAEALPVFTQGETVRLAGQVEDYFGQRQVNTVQSITQLGFGATVTPMTVDAASVATNGVDAVSMEGVLVTVSGVAVQELNPAAGPGDMDPTNEFVITGGLRVDDYVYSFTLPSVGDQFGSITGVMRLGNADYKLIPRAATDLQR